MKAIAEAVKAEQRAWDDAFAAEGRLTQARIAWARGPDSDALRLCSALTAAEQYRNSAWVVWSQRVCERCSLERDAR